MGNFKSLPKKQTIVILCLLGLFGIHGIHRLRMGYDNGWLMTISSGGWWAWTLLDLTNITKNKMPMSEGRVIEG